MVPAMDIEKVETYFKKKTCMYPVLFLWFEPTIID